MEELDQDWLLKMLENPNIRQKLKSLLKTKRKKSTNSKRHKKRPMESPIGSYANNLELKILKTIFKWKLMPSSTLRWMLTPNEKRNSFNQRKIRMQDRNLIKHVNLGGKLSLYQLGADGFSRLKHELDGFKEDGFLSEAPWHDFVVMTLQLGLWLIGNPENVELISEQQMRRFEKSYLPYWVPDPALHRPDGYTRFKNGNDIKLVAYEVELSRKSADRYDSICQFYSKSQDVDLVIWLVRNKALMNFILKRAALFSESLGKHCFILMDEFKTSFWDSKFKSGQEGGRSLADLMSLLSHCDVTSLSLACHHSIVNDFRKMLTSV